MPDIFIKNKTELDRDSQLKCVQTVYVMCLFSYKNLECKHFKCFLLVKRTASKNELYCFKL